MEDIEIVDNPFHNHAPEFEGFEELQGKILCIVHRNRTIINENLANYRQHDQHS